MINCLLIKISRNKRGLLSRSYRTHTVEEMTIGRAAECTIHLLDPRVAMHHAVIKRLDDGKIHLMALHGEIEIEGISTQNIVLNHGSVVTIGPYQLKVEPAPPDVDIAISVLLQQPLPDDFQDLKLRTHEPLRGATSFKRKFSLWLALLIALIFLVLPIAQNFVGPLHSVMAKLPIGFDRAWSPGHISNSHLHFGAQCFNCHEQLTARVTDQACVKCHQNTAPHIASPALQHSVFGKKGLFSDGIHCAECHREHKSPLPLARQNNTLCVSCHRDIKSIAPKTEFANVQDFDRKHPDFKLTFKDNGTHNLPIRIPQADHARLIEKSGLKFPHSQHFGMVQGPKGIWDVRELACTDCHHPAGKEMRMQPLSFKRDCQSCHISELELASGNNKFTVPHGIEENVVNAIKAQAPQQLANDLASLKTGGCAYCHQINENLKGNAVPWRVEPLAINQDWFSKARFNHAAHRTQQCQSCHQVENSESSADVAMPDRHSCLRCHSGNSPKPKRIASNCISCHTFHAAHLAKDNNVLPK